MKEAMKQNLSRFSRKFLLEQSMSRVCLAICFAVRTPKRVISLPASSHLFLNRTTYKRFKSDENLHFIKIFMPTKFSVVTSCNGGNNSTDAPFGVILLSVFTFNFYYQLIHKENNWYTRIPYKIISLKRLHSSGG